MAKGLINHTIIEIGPEDCKVGVTNAQGLIDNAFEVELSQGQIDSQYKHNFDHLGPMLKEKLSENRIKQKKCALIVKDFGIVVRNMKFPTMPEEQMRENILLEIDSYLPFSADKYSIDYKDIASLDETNKNKSTVIVVAMQKEILTNIVQALKQANLRVLSVDVLENAYDKLFEKIRIPEVNNFAILNIGKAGVNFSIFHTGKHFISKHICNGLSSEADYIVEQSALNKKEASNFLKGDIIKIASPNSKHKHFARYMSRIVSDISRVVDYYSARNDAVLDKMFIFDEGAEIKNINEYFSTNTGIPTENINEYLKYHYTKRINKNSYMKFSSLISASLREEEE